MFKTAPAKFCAVLIFMTLFSAACKTIHLNNICRLPKILDESSGLIVTNNNLFWSHNDSGGKPALYELDAHGKLLRTLRITNAKNIDWEEITLDKNDNLYIGDFGNNSNKRRDLTIYKIAKFSEIKTDSVAAEKISFKYEDQFDYPPAPAFKHFDCEAMLVINDSIYIFTKDFYTQPYSGKSRVYAMPNKPGSYTARLVKILDTDNSSHFNGAITGAAMSENGTIALLAYERLWIFDNYASREEFWKGRVRKFSFGKTQFTQREGVAFEPHSDCKMYFTSEHSLPFSGHLSSVDICKNESKSNEVLVQIKN